MDHTITPTWATVELPILRAIVQADLDGTDPDEAVNAIANGMGIEVGRLHRVLLALRSAGYITGAVAASMAGDELYMPTPCERARRAVGQWPTADALSAQLAAAFEQAADAETDVERKLSYREAAKAIVTGVATTAITKYMGL